MKRNVANRRDPRDEPTYTAVEAAQYLYVPVSTVRSWALGNRYPTCLGGTRQARPLFSVVQRKPLSLSFFNLVEAYVIATIRRQHTISMPRLRSAIDYTKRELGAKRPLIEKVFLTDGVNLFVDEVSRHLVNVSQEGQLALRAVLTNALRRIDRDPKGLAIRLYPYRDSPGEPRHFEIDPWRSFGRLVVKGTRIPAEVIADRFYAGDSIETLAKDYGLPFDRIEMAVRWDRGAQAA